MFNFLHHYNPSPVIFQIGKVAFYWYGLFIVFGIIAGLFIVLRLADLYSRAKNSSGESYQIEKERILDLSFLLIIFGIIGARLFAGLYNWGHFSLHPLDILKIWQGGMSIHGAIIAGIIVLFFFCRRYKLIFWFLADLIAPGLILGQAIGRWGNYFNQELYGLPTSSIFGIPISLQNRIVGYENFSHFHPVFLYEFILNLIIFGVLIWLHKRNVKFEKSKYSVVFLTYLILYSATRFFLEFLRVDIQPVILDLRFGQWISLLIIIISFAIIIVRKKPPCFLFLKRS